MRYLLILVLGASLISCSNGEIETLKTENEALRIAVQENRNRAEEAAAAAREAEASALIAMMEAEKQRELAAKALADCEGK